jgi:prepilin peptidase CpaA
MDFAQFTSLSALHGHIWLVTVVLVVAAVIDGWLLKVPNWLTFPFIIAGWIFSAVYSGGEPWYVGLGYSLAGTALGFALLYPFCFINFMGAGDVKLLMGVGAWVHVTNTWYAFCLSAVIGALLAMAMAALWGEWQKHYVQFWGILDEIQQVGDPAVLAERAAERKPRMLLLPYGIPIAIGSIAYFAWTGMLL